MDPSLRLPSLRQVIAYRVIDTFESARLMVGNVGQWTILNGRPKG